MANAQREVLHCLQCDVPAYGEKTTGNAVQVKCPAVDSLHSYVMSTGR